MLSMTFYILSRFPRVKARVLEELEEVLGPVTGESVTPSVEDLNRLEYMTAVLKEVLRLFPVGPATGRRTETAEKIGPYDIPEDTTIVVSFFSKQHDNLL